ncbi:hypothetical protein JCM8097_005276 [Rhodosporidiobolus ruineniae]
MSAPPEEQSITSPPPPTDFTATSFVGRVYYEPITWRNQAELLLASDPEYSTCARIWPRQLLPADVLSQYRHTVDCQTEPSISPALLSLLELVQPELPRLRRFQALEKRVAELLGPPGSVSGVLCAYGLEKLGRLRYEAVLWLDDLWQRCLDLERADGIQSEDRARERFLRFPPQVFPTLAERNDAELEALGK